MTPAEQAEAALHVEQTIADLKLAIAKLDVSRLGFVEVSRLSIGGESAGAIQQAIAFLERRLQFMRQALAALENLKGDDYPKVPKRIVSGEIQEELLGKLESIKAALEEVMAGKLKLKPPVVE